MQVRIQQLGPGMVQQIQTVCSECQGQGERISAKDRCKNCQGKKTTRERKILEVHIDKGQSQIDFEQFTCICPLCKELEKIYMKFECLVHVLCF